MKVVIKLAIGSLDKEYYDSEKTTKEGLNDWLRENEIYWRYTKRVICSDLKGERIQAIELGAGSCWLSAELSKLSRIESVICADISKQRMLERFPLVLELLGGDRAKIRFLMCDFNVKLPFKDESFDLVLFDAALHHSRRIWETLQETRRILRVNGVMIAQREGCLAPLSFKRQLKRTLTKSDEVKFGVSENLYLREQYEYLLKANGFDVRFVPVNSNRKQKMLWFTNGLLFSNWLIVAKRAY